MTTIIVGGGIMGLSTAWGLAREGHEVELFEQASLPNPLASSIDEHRLLRHPYGDHAGYARMIDPAFAAWDLLCRDLGGDRPADDRAHPRAAAPALPLARRTRRRTRVLDRHRRRAVRPGHR